MLLGHCFFVSWRSVNPLMSTLGLDEAEGSDAELSGAVTDSLRSFFEQLPEQSSRGKWPRSYFEQSLLEPRDLEVGSSQVF